MQQVGAALTDWGVALACLASLAALWSRARGLPRTPTWYSCFMGVYLAEGLACFAGGFMWGGGENKTIKLMQELSPGAQVWGFVMILGMATEGLFLILASRALSVPEGDGSFSRWRWLVAVAFVSSCAFYLLSVGANLPPSVTYQVLVALAAGLVDIAVTAARSALASDDAFQRACWRRVLAGACLNLTGAAVLAGLDGDCTGACCITELMRWGPSPCRYGAVFPPGSSCPLPEWFNHAAVMHALAMLSCAVTVPGLCGLLEAGWEPHPRKPHHG